MKIQRKNKGRAGVTAALESVDKDHGRTLARLGEGIDKGFAAAGDALIGRYRNALKRLSKK